MPADATHPARRTSADRAGPYRERFLCHLAALREFLYRFGRETNQEVVVAELIGSEGS